MYIVQNALLNLIKNKGRNILLFSVMLAVIVSVAVGINMFNQANHVIDAYSDTFSRRVTIAPARRQVSANSDNQAQHLPLEQLLLFSTSFYLESTQIKVAGRTYEPDDEELMSLLEEFQNGEMTVAIEAVYYLSSSDLLSAFEADVRGMGLSDDFNVNVNMAEYHRLIAPVERLEAVALTFLVVVLLLGSIIISLICVISINERKYEIGILRSLGMKKIQVASGLMVEILTMMMIAFTFAMVIGGILTTPVINFMMNTESQVIVQTQLSVRSALEIFGLSTLLIIFAGSFAISKITKYEPNIILTERG